ncbi:hypothetical protein TUM17567_43710 [Citrobacter amalonaticus]|nr:hypothetical protein TUM17567_43710 [Citrobacter amalonaticus]
MLVGNTPDRMLKHLIRPELRSNHRPDKRTAPSGKKLQQLRQTVNIRLNRPGSDVTPGTGPADH